MFLNKTIVCAQPLFEVFIGQLLASAVVDSIQPGHCGFAITVYTTLPPCIAGLYQLPPQVKYDALLIVVDPQPEGKLGRVDPIGNDADC
jgi:hypothetical protein